MNKIKMSMFTLVLFLASCSVLNKLTQFHLTYQYDINAPAAAAANMPIDVVTPDIVNTASQDFANNKTSGDNIQSLKLEGLELDITNPTGANFDFVKSVYVYLQVSGLPEIELAHKDPVVTGSGAKLTLDIANQELKEYLKKDKYNLHLKFTTANTPTQAMAIHAVAKYFVDAKILGI